MVTIVLSYLLVASILAKFIGGMLGQPGLIVTVITLVLGVGALWVAVQHIKRKSMVSGGAVIKTVVSTELIFLIVGGGLLAYGTTLPTISASMTTSGIISLVLSLVVYGLVLYSLLRNAVTTSQMLSQ